MLFITTPDYNKRIGVAVTISVCFKSPSKKSVISFSISYMLFQACFLLVKIVISIIIITVNRWLFMYRASQAIS